MDIRLLCLSLFCNIVLDVPLFPLQQCCQPCGFLANLGLFFCEVAVFLKTCGLLVLIGICLFFIDLFLWIAFFQILWHFLF